MNAIEAKLKTHEKEYDAVMEAIDVAAEEGGSRVSFIVAGLTNTTIDALLKEHYDVTITTIVEDQAYKVKVSWLNASADRDGILIKKTKEEAFEELCKSHPLLGLMKDVTIPDELNPELAEKLDELADGIADVFADAMGEFDMDEDVSESPTVAREGSEEKECDCDGNCSCGNNCTCGAVPENENEENAE